MMLNCIPKKRENLLTKIIISNIIEVVKKLKNAFETFLATLESSNRQEKTPSHSRNTGVFIKYVYEQILLEGGFFMDRKIYQELIKWKNSDMKKPLMIIGARQIGKTYIIVSGQRKYV